jgi:hypothetical protein
LAIGDWRLVIHELAIGDWRLADLRLPIGIWVAEIAPFVFGVRHSLLKSA